MAITIWRLVTTAAFIASRRTLRFKWTASARFRRSSLFPFPHSPAASAALLLLLSALLARCRFSRIATWLVPFANLYAGHDNSLSYPASGSVCPVSRVQSQPAALVIYVARDSSVPVLPCLALPDWRRSAVGVCSLCACFIIMPSSYAQRSHYLPHTLYTMYTIYIHTYTFMYCSSALCIPPLSPAFSHAIVVSLAINLSLRIIKFVCSSNYAP